MGGQGVTVYPQDTLHPPPTLGDPPSSASRVTVSWSRTLCGGSESLCINQCSKNIRFLYSFKNQFKFNFDLLSWVCEKLKFSHLGAAPNLG